MELNINSPAYYTKQFGVVDDIYNMCQEIREVVRNKKYSSIINIVGIIPIIAPADVIESGLFKEIKRCEVKYGFATVSLQIDYEKFVNADIEEKKKMIVNNILASIKSIHRRAKIDFEEFSKDIIQYCQQANIIL